ncbi:hypothetical protein HanIR_Chr13g0642681 [Helianthus annuus]|nr:hypothetical protein HanIR_Chr13g0642681 [Helianthus annuus]
MHTTKDEKRSDIRTRVNHGCYGCTTEVAGSTHATHSLIIVIKSIRSMVFYSIRHITRLARLNSAAVRLARPTSPVQPILQARCVSPFSCNTKPA